MQNTLKQKVAEFEALAENAPVWIIRIDTKGVIEYINHVLPEYDKNDVIGTSVFNFVLPGSQDVYRENIEDAVRTGKTKFFDLKSEEIKGKHLYYEVHMAPIKVDGEITGLVVISTDVTEKIRAKEELEKSLREKDALLKEVHHRAKNNLQVISSILNLHSRKTDDEKTLSILTDCKTSIQSLALVHECLYKSNDFSQISLSDYISRFCQHFERSMLDRTRIKLEKTLQDARISMDRATTCGLIVNELLVNIYKHAFPEEEGRIKVSLENKNEELTLTISDNGVGIPDEVLKSQESFGFDLVNMMIEQLDGKIITQSEVPSGTRHIITFLSGK